MDNQQDFLVEQNNELLLEGEADIEAKNNHEETPLHFASFKGHLEVVNLLIEKGADIKAKNNLGNTPLHYASFYGRIEIIKLLLEKGADPEIKNDQGEDFLSLIKDNQKRKSIEEFLFEMNSRLIKG